MANRVVLLALLAILLLILLVTSVSFVVYFFMTKIDVKDYVIIFDAGSSGTRTHVYEWNADYNSNKNNQLVIKEVLYCVNDDNGVDKFKSVEEIKQKYSKCIHKANNVIPDSRKNRTKINLIGTAGMRLLELNSANFSKSVLDLVREYFYTTGYRIDNSAQVRVLSGIDEAVMAWISANYFEKNFQNEISKTKGILDLGGASTQIVFASKETDGSLENRHMKLFGNEYTAFSQSFLCYGLNEANLMYRVNLLKKNNYKDEIVASCMPINATYNLTKAIINKSPCVNGNIYKEKLPDEALKRENFKINGGSNYEKCTHDVKELFANKRPCNLNESACSFQNAQIPNFNHTKFLAISSFWYAIQESNKLWDKKLDGDFETFNLVTKQVCSLSLEQLETLNEINKANLVTWRLLQQCFQNVYTIELLKQYGFNSLEHIRTVDEINGFTVGWTMGYLISELNKDDYLPEEDLPRKLPLIFFIIIVSLFFIIGFGLIGLIAVFLKRYSKN